MIKKTRLSPENWLQAGLAALVSHGPQALKAEPLARALGTTKGSFYWHFADVPAFHEALLIHWVQMARAALPDLPGDKAQAVQHLRSLIQTGFDSTGTLGDSEPALRSWAQSDVQAAQAMLAIDTARIGYLTRLLSQIGITNGEIARILYAAQIGTTDLAQREKTTAGAGAMGTLVDLVLALR